MKNLKKLILLGITCIIAALSLVSCNPKASEETKPTEQQPYRSDWKDLNSAVDGAFK